MLLLSLCTLSLQMRAEVSAAKGQMYDDLKAQCESLQEDVGRLSVVEATFKRMEDQVRKHCAVSWSSESSRTKSRKDFKAYQQLECVHVLLMLHRQSSHLLCKTTPKLDQAWCIYSSLLVMFLPSLALLAEITKHYTSPVHPQKVLSIICSILLQRFLDTGISTRRTCGQKQELDCDMKGEHPPVIFAAER